MKVLLIDDDKDMAFLMDVFLRKSELVDQYYVASTGMEALKYLQEDNEKPDVIFIDLIMPDISGFEFIKQFESKLEKKFPDTHLYILTGSALKEDKVKAMGYSSVNGYILKPLNSTLLREINITLKQPPSPEELLKAKDQKKRKQKKKEKVPKQKDDQTMKNNSPVCYSNSNEVRKEYKD